MFDRAEASNREDVFLPLSRRRTRGVYFLRLSAYSRDTEDYIWRFHEEARQRGVIIEGQLSNPDDRQLNYYTDTLGSAFEPSPAFVADALTRWMPRMSAITRKEFADSICGQLAEMKAAGKTDSILKNVYIKMMCWLYYRCERVIPFLGGDPVPKILYEGSSITRHELIFLRMMSAIGTDILLLETKGDDAYLRLDPVSGWSQLLSVPEGITFPPDFSLKTLRKERAKTTASVRSKPVTSVSRAAAAPHSAAPGQRSTVSAHSPGPGVVRTQPPDPEDRFPAPARSACTNAWMKKADMDQILLPPTVRGDDPGLFYNAFIRMNGARDKLTYTNELYQLYQQLTAAGRKVFVIDGTIPKAEPEELNRIRRRPYRSATELIVDLAGNLPACASVELQRSVQRSFVRTMKDAAREEPNLNRLTVTAVYLLCWIQRYQGQIFQGWKETDIPVLLKMGACDTIPEALYLLYLSRLPADVLIFSPNLNQICALKAETLLEISGGESLPVMKFPRQSGSLQMRTVASHAEQDLTRIMYQDSGLYRNRQFDQAETITLRTTYDEIFILWNQELKYRPNFSTGDHTANIPVLYAKISGVEEGKITPYWQKFRMLRNSGDTLTITEVPFIRPGVTNPYQALAVKSIRNDRILRDVIRSHRQYPFGLLREEMQEHILDKLQQMLDQRLIKGTFVNGTEYTILATVLNMKKELIRMIQGFDFTKKNPKILIINTRDQAPSLEDAILLTFLNKLGFDIVLFVPTGYQMIERYLNDNIPVEHQIGEYLYDLPVPDFNTLPPEKSHSWLNNLFRR